MKKPQLPKPHWRNGVFYSEDPNNWCRNCLKDWWRCLNQIAKDGKRMCGRCRASTSVRDFHCNSYWCRPCFSEYSYLKRAGETYSIECSYCGDLITKGPFCSETCRKKFEQVIREGITEIKPIKIVKVKAKAAIEEPKPKKIFRATNNNLSIMEKYARNQQGNQFSR